MKYLLLCTEILLSSSQSILSKQYSLKGKNNNPFIYCSVTSLFALLFFIISAGGKLNFNTSFMPYSVAFGIAYGLATIGSVCAIKNGPLSVSSLITSYSLIIPTLYGVVFLKESVTVLAYIGIGLLAVSLFLINVKKEEDMKFSVVWVVWIMIAFFGNGMCSTIQKMQQLRFDGGYKSEYMIAALVVSVLICLFASFTQTGSKRKALIGCIKYAPFAGIANGIVNLFTMILTGMMSNSVLFPSISAGGIAVSFVVSVTVYKERLSKAQLLGYTAGIASVILLNL